MARIPGEHLVINKTSQVPAFLEEAKQVARHGQMKMAIFDIEGCYPNMPKETIRFALRDVLKQMETKYGYDGVWVPKWSDTRPCGWKKGKGFNMQKIPFEVMLDVMEFSLDFALIRMPNGQILRQTGGIPMGDPLSPGMTIGSCAWMEQEWLKTIDASDRKFFRAKRFMDDIAIVYASTPRWDSERFIADFTQSQCYQEPLKLEPGKDGTFLETRVWIRNNQMRHKLKNDNEGGQTKIWRYKHFDDGSPFMEKRATLTACLKNEKGTTHGE